MSTSATATATDFQTELEKYRDFLAKKVALVRNLSTTINRLQANLQSTNTEYQNAIAAINTIEELLSKEDGYDKDKFLQFIASLSQGEG